MYLQNNTYIRSKNTESQARINEIHIYIILLVYCTQSFKLFSDECNYDKRM